MQISLVILIREGAIIAELEEVSGLVDCSERFLSSKRKKSRLLLTIYSYFGENFEEILKLAGTFAEKNQTFEIFPTAEKLGKQFAYADKKGIPYVIIYGQGEKEADIYKIRDMKT